MSSLYILCLYIFVPVVLSLTGALLCLRLKYRRRKKAVCWFCHRQQQQLGSDHEISWTCRYCQQYNGFTEVGEYDREMTEQYDGGNQPIRYCFRGPNGVATPTSSLEFLCAQCQLNLQLKVAQLAAFQPSCEESFEQEAEEYECSVEKLYPLCDQCEEKVTNEISRRNHTIRPHLLNNASKVRRNKKATGTRWPLKLLEWSAIVFSLLEAVSLFSPNFNCSSASVITRCTAPLDSMPEAKLTYFREPGGEDAVETLQLNMPSKEPYFVLQLRSDYDNGSCPVGINGVQWPHLNSRVSDKYDRFSWADRLWCTTVLALCWLSGIVACRTALAVLLLLSDVILLVRKHQTNRLSVVLVLSDVALLSYVNGYARLHLLTVAEQMKQGISGVVGGVIGVSSVLRLALWWWGKRRRWRIVRHQGAKEKDYGTSQQQSMPFSFGGLSIGRHDKLENGHSPKSWLKTLEEMQLLPGNCGDSNLQPRADAFDIPVEASCTIRQAGDSPPVHHPPSYSGKGIIKPATFRYRRFSISSATAALSLNDNTREMCPSPLPLMMPPPNATHLHSQDSLTPDFPARKSGGMGHNGPGLPRKQPRRRAHSICCSHTRCVCVVLVASVFSNLLLLAILLLHHSPSPLH